MFGLKPIFKERIWGAEELPAPYPQPEKGKPVGEVWLTAEECRVSEGPWAGKTLGEVAASVPEALGAGGGFPLLLKVLLPKEKLSVQVHPDDAEARLLGEKRGKTECWYVLEAEPGASVACGLKAGVSVEDVKAGIADGSMESLMQMVPVKAGDMVFVDAGTVHAIGPGMVVLETQQYSDITYRMFDYGRPRELHVEQGLGVTKTATKAGLVAPMPMDGFVRVVESEYFAVDRFELTAGNSVPLGSAGRLQILFALGDGCSVRCKNGDAELRVPKGEVVVLPAEGVEHEVRAHAGAVVMRILQP
jgi:mannose-6-phosphate isomerase